MNQERDFKGVWIPSDIWYDTNLSVIARCYVAIFKAEGEAKADGLMLKVISPFKLKSLKANLVLKKYIKLTRNSITSPQEAKEFVIQNSHVGYKCEWCGKESYILHSHHYPVSKKLGGKQIVKICPNCHYTYHAIYGED